MDRVVQNIVRDPDGDSSIAELTARVKVIQRLLSII